MSSGGQFFMIYLVHAALLGPAAELLDVSGMFWRAYYRYTGGFRLPRHPQDVIDLTRRQRSRVPNWTVRNRLSRFAMPGAKVVLMGIVQQTRIDCGYSLAYHLTMFGLALTYR